MLYVKFYTSVFIVYKYVCVIALFMFILLLPIFVLCDIII